MVVAPGFGSSEVSAVVEARGFGLSEVVAMSEALGFGLLEVEAVVEGLGFGSLEVVAMAKARGFGLSEVVAMEEDMGFGSSEVAAMVEDLGFGSFAVAVDLAIQPAKLIAGTRRHWPSKHLGVPDGCRWLQRGDGEEGQEHDEEDAPSSSTCESWVSVRGLMWSMFVGPWHSWLYSGKHLL